MKTATTLVSTCILDQQHALTLAFSMCVSGASANLG